MRVGSACSGAGLLDRALVAEGHEIAWHSEVEPHGCRVLEARFPGVPNLGDLTKLKRPPKVDALVGGIPCQGNSQAGRRAGEDDERNLWPAFRELVGVLRPAVALVENVTGILTVSGGGLFGGILQNAKWLGYSVEWDCLPACAFVDRWGMRSPHRRDRVVLVMRRDGRTTWPCDGEQSSMCVPARWPQAGRWDGALHARPRRYPVWRGDYAPAQQAWATPSARDWKNGKASDATFERNARPLSEQVERLGPWTTARAGDAKQGDSSTEKHLATGDLMLTDQVRLGPWSTACAAEAVGRTQSDKALAMGFAPVLSDAVRLALEGSRRDGRLNPRWTETLMGCPAGWTDPELEPVELPHPLGIAERDGVRLYGDSPQGEWEPPRLVAPARGDGRAAQLRCIGNGVEGLVGRELGRLLAQVEEHENTTAPQAQEAER